VKPRSAGTGPGRRHPERRGERLAEFSSPFRKQKAWDRLGVSSAACTIRPLGGAMEFCRLVDRKPERLRRRHPVAMQSAYRRASAPVPASKLLR
jgi:hypothetical protein